MTTAEIGSLRRRMRSERRRLSPADRAIASEVVCGELLALVEARRYRATALYVSYAGEVDLAPFAVEVRARGLDTLYPVVLEDDSLEFRSWDGVAPMEPGRYGIPEPAGGASLGIPAIDLVLAPVVAFDRAGHRLGSGRGCYDRTFAERPVHPEGRPTPPIAGVAYRFQEVDTIEADPWDVDLDGVVTPDGVRWWR